MSGGAGRGRDSGLLEVEDLNVRFRQGESETHVVRGVSFTVAEGETLGVVGESGSGKSVMARSLMRLLPTPPAVVDARSIQFDGRDLLALGPRELRSYRGAQLAMVYQDPSRALNPIMRAGDQIAEAIRAHDRDLPRRAVRQRVLELLDGVRIPDAARRAQLYPHQLSGGMRQRVVIAMALAARPRLLIADEPTTALDVTVQAEILDLLSDLQADLGMAMMFITHDLGVAAWHTDRVMVMYAGRVVEEAPTPQLFDSMRMPYTQALLDSMPRLEAPSHEPLRAIAGRPANPAELDGGCPFHPRCVRADDRCRSTEPDAVAGSAEHRWACWNPLVEERPSR